MNAYRDPSSASPLEQYSRLRQVVYVKKIFILIFVLSIMLNSYITVANPQVSYSFDGAGVLICNDTLQPASLTLELRRNWSIFPTIIFGKNNILTYINNDTVKEIISNKLENISRIYVKAQCGYGSPVESIYYNNSHKLFIIFNVGPCYIANATPVVVRTHGYAAIFSDSRGGYGVSGILALSLPLYQPEMVSNISISCGYNGILNLNNTTYIRFNYSQPRVSPVVNGSVVWVSPFLPVFPRNASEVRELYNNNINVYYNNFRLRIVMEPYRGIASHYDEPPKLINSSVIVAYVDNEQYDSGVEAALDTLRGGVAELVYRDPIVRGGSKLSVFFLNNTDYLANLVVDVLLGESVVTEYADSMLHVRVESLYSYGFGAELSGGPYMTYHYIYPISFNLFPIKIKYNESNIIIALFIPKITYTSPSGFDPFQIPIGYYSPEEHNRSVPLLPIAAGTIAAVAVVACLVFCFKKWRGNAS